jgi:hypothetical protein
LRRLGGEQSFTIDVCPIKHVCPLILHL